MCVNPSHVCLNPSHLQTHTSKQPVSKYLFHLVTWDHRVSPLPPPGGAEEKSRVKQRSVEALGWVCMPLFNFRHVLTCGRKLLGLWPSSSAPSARSSSPNFSQPDSVILQRPCWQWTCLPEIYGLLRQWACLGPLDALGLLHAQFPDQELRRTAVQWMDSISDAELLDFLPQLVQALKYECYLDSSLVRFLLRRGIKDVRIAHHLFWLLKDNLQDGQFSARYQTLLAALLCCVGRGTREELDRQNWMVSVLTGTAHRVRDAPGSNRQVRDTFWSNRQVRDTLWSNRQVRDTLWSNRQVRDPLWSNRQVRDPLWSNRQVRDTLWSNRQVRDPLWSNRQVRDTFWSNRQVRDPLWSNRQVRDTLWSNRQVRDPLWSNRQVRDPLWSNRQVRDPLWSNRQLFPRESLQEMEQMFSRCSDVSSLPGCPEGEPSGDGADVYGCPQVFSRCSDVSSLFQVVLRESLQEMEQMFSRCSDVSSLFQVVLRESLQEMEQMFRCFSSLFQVVLRESLQEMEQMFRCLNDSSLFQVVLRESLQEMEQMFRCLNVSLFQVVLRSSADVQMFLSSVPGCPERESSGDGADV
ncbi:hypothetical protein WMY93_011121 [Mugilogobius chulae]|uniref:Uncharacterized protein n=1 Tax=Mugilogobius chulae TaxID=88201 RepID=A0AAW0P329_9GOBI